MKLTVDIDRREMNDIDAWRASKPLRELGYARRPVVKFGDHAYVLLFDSIPHPGHNTLDVIDITDFNQRGDHFQIWVTTGQQRRDTVGWAWVKIEEFISIITETKNGDLYDYGNPFTAVLSFRVVPPTRADAHNVAEELMQDLEEYGF